MTPPIEKDPDSVLKVLDKSAKTNKTKKGVKENIVSLMTRTKEKEKTSEEEIICPFPEWKEYKKIRDRIPSDQKKLMKKNIGKKDAEGKIEILPMKKKFGFLTAEANHIDILDEWRRDKNGEAPVDKGIRGVRYFKKESAIEECRRQGKSLLKNEEEVKRFIKLFPGKTTKQRVLNFVKLFGLEKTGNWDPYGKAWSGVGGGGDIGMAEDGTYVVWSAIDAYIQWFGGSYYPYIVSEDC